MSSEIKINLLILVNNENYFLCISSVQPKELITCNFLRILIYIGVYAVCANICINNNLIADAPM